MPMRGKSGLRLNGRDALKRLIEDVQSGKADFTSILVYDVSRWGRFRDDPNQFAEFAKERRRALEGGRASPRPRGRR